VLSCSAETALNTNAIMPRSYLTFIVGTDHSLLTVWQQFRPLGALWLCPNGPDCR